MHTLDLKDLKDLKIIKKPILRIALCFRYAQTLLNFAYAQFEGAIFK